MVSNTLFFRLRRSPCRGFSMVELMLAIILVTVLMLLALPIGEKLRRSGHMAGCINNLRQLGAANAASAIDRDGNWGYYRHPSDISTYSGARNAVDGKSISMLRDVAPYVQSYDVFFCPADTKFKQSYGKRDFAKEDAYASYVIRGRNTMGNTANALSPKLGMVAGNAIVSCYFLAIPGNANHTISHHDDRWPVLFGDGHIVVIPMPEGITPTDYPKIYDATGQQGRIWRYFDENP